MTYVAYLTRQILSMKSKLISGAHSRIVIAFLSLSESCNLKSLQGLEVRINFVVFFNDIVNFC